MPWQTDPLRVACRFDWLYIVHSHQQTTHHEESLPEPFYAFLTSVVCNSLHHCANGMEFDTHLIIITKRVIQHGINYVYMYCKATLNMSIILQLP